MCLWFYTEDNRLLRALRSQFLESTHSRNFVRGGIKFGLDKNSSAAVCETRKGQRRIDFIH